MLWSLTQTTANTPALQAKNAAAAMARHRTKCERKLKTWHQATPFQNVSSVLNLRVFLRGSKAVRSSPNSSSLSDRVDDRLAFVDPADRGDLENRTRRAERRIKADKLRQNFEKQQCC